MNPKKGRQKIAIFLIMVGILSLAGILLIVLTRGQPDFSADFVQSPLHALVCQV